MLRFFSSFLRTSTDFSIHPIDICRPLFAGNKFAITQNINLVPKCLMKIYTRTGDSGESSLYTGERRAKTDSVFHALGSVDELSSSIGIVVANLEIQQISKNIYDLSTLIDRLIKIQCLLQDVGSCIATPIEYSDSNNEIAKRPKRYSRIQFHESSITDLEKWIDEMSNCLPPLREFIIPSGGLAASHLHLSRSICRRAERMVLILNSGNNMYNVETSVVKFLNRLSDFLFTAARFSCYAGSFPEKKFRPTLRAYSGDRYGSGKGKGGGSGGSIRDAGGSLGEREVAQEEIYFKKMQAKQLEDLKKHLDDEVKHHEMEIKRHKELIDRHRKKIKDLSDD